MSPSCRFTRPRLLRSFAFRSKCIGVPFLREGSGHAVRASTLEPSPPSPPYKVHFGARAAAAPNSICCCGLFFPPALCFLDCDQDSRTQPHRPRCLTALLQQIEKCCRDTVTIAELRYGHR